MPRLQVTPEPGERHLKSVPTAWDTARRIEATEAELGAMLIAHPDWAQDDEDLLLMRRYAERLAGHA